MHQMLKMVHVHVCWLASVDAGETKIAGRILPMLLLFLEKAALTISSAWLPCWCLQVQPFKQPRQPSIC